MKGKGGGARREKGKRERRKEECTSLRADMKRNILILMLEHIRIIPAICNKKAVHTWHIRWNGKEKVREGASRGNEGGIGGEIPGLKVSGSSQ